MMRPSISVKPGRSPALQAQRFEWPQRDTGINQNRRSDRAPQAPVAPAVVISPSESVIRHRIDWRGMAAETVAVTRYGRVEFQFRDVVHLLVLLESGARAAGLTYVDGHPRSALKNYKGKLIFVPAGHEYVDWHETQSLTRLAYFYFEPGTLPLDAGTLEPRLFFEDAELLKTAFKLKMALERPQARDLDYCHALGRVLTHDLARLVSGSRRVDWQVRGGLAAWQQRVVLRHLDERIAEPVSLATLAALVQLSPCHFCRAFKQSFDMPPHRYHSHRRIERAKVLLATTRMVVGEVGLAIGFCSAGAFTMAFHRITGMTPTEYRRSAI
jgi:AraC family transcriptional regulator